MLKFSFSGKGLGLISSPHAVYDFLRKSYTEFLVLHSVKLQLIKFQSDYLYFLKCWAICVLQLFVHHVVTS